MKAKFIVIEGIEGAGKSTAIEYVKDFLHKKNIRFIQTREPGGTELSEDIRELFKKEYTKETFYSETEVLLLYAARVQLVNNIIKPALENNTWVIGDRHDLSTIAYQSGGRGIDHKLISNIKNSVLGDFTFDICLYLDIDPKIGLERASSRGELDRIEQESIKFFASIRNKYNELALVNNKIITVDAEQEREKIRQDINNILEEVVNKI